MPTWLGKDLLIVEDILDTGMTLHYLKQLLRTATPTASALRRCWISRAPPSRRARRLCGLPGAG